MKRTSLVFVDIDQYVMQLSKPQYNYEASIHDRRKGNGGASHSNIWRPVVKSDRTGPANHKTRKEKAERVEINNRNPSTTKPREELILTRQSFSGVERFEPTVVRNVHDQPLVAETTQKGWNRRSLSVSRSYSFPTMSGSSIEWSFFAAGSAITLGMGPSKGQYHPQGETRRISAPHIIFGRGLKIWRCNSRSTGSYRDASCIGAIKPHHSGIK